MARFLLRLIVAPVLLALAACQAHSGVPGPVGPGSASEQPVHLTLIGTNDLHGWIYPHRSQKGDAPALEQGGVAALAGYVKILREQNPEGTLLLDAGDLFQGTLASNFTEGAVVIEAMNRLGYQAAAIGNHEFDYGPVGPASTATQPSDDPFGALKERLRQARFPLLAVNIYDARTGQRPEWLGNDGTALLDVAGIKVGILGLITPTTPQVTNPVNVSGLRFGSLVPEALSAARRLRDRGASVVVAVAHAGGKCARWQDPHDLSTCDLSGEIFELLQALPEHTLDAVVAGHTHAPLGQFVRGTPVIETWGLGLSFGVIDLYVDPRSGKVLEPRTAIAPAIPVCSRVDASTQSCELRTASSAAHLVPATFRGEKVAPDAEVALLVTRAMKEVASEQNRRLGVLVPSRLARNYESESPLGDVLADALKQMEGADVALLNSGGLRADLPAGELTYGAFYEVVPFDNAIATLSVTGDQLKRLLVAAYGAKKGVFQQAGLQITLSKCPGPRRLKAFVLSDGRPIASAREYKVVLPDFLARGGDGLGPVMASLSQPRIDLGEARALNFRDSLVAFWQKKKARLVAPKRGRLSFADDGEACNQGANMDLHARSH